MGIGIGITRGLGIGITARLGTPGFGAKIGSVGTGKGIITGLAKRTGPGITRGLGASIFGAGNGTTRTGKGTIKGLGRARLGAEIGGMGVCTGIAKGLGATGIRGVGAIGSD